MARTPKTDGAHLPDELVDSVDKTFRRLRKATVKPPSAQLPMPCLGHPLDMAKIFACDAVADLQDQGAPVTVKDVALTLDLEHSTVSRLLGELEDDGLITRGVDPSDRRKTTVELTELGHSVVSDSTTISRTFTRLLLADWTKTEVEELARVMNRLAGTIHDRLALLPELFEGQDCGSALSRMPRGTDASS